jgi:hypothetical protein
MLDHHRVVNELFARVDACLPARFPTVVDAAQLTSLVHQRRDDLLRQLDTVRDACELAISAAWTAPAPESSLTDMATPGTRYLLRRQRELSAMEQRRGRATELASALDRALGDTPRATRREVCPSSTILLSYAVLLSQRDVECVKQRIASPTQVAADVRILVNGPWPPYTFASVRS